MMNIVFLQTLTLLISKTTKPVIDAMNKLNKSRKAIFFLTFDFPTLYTKLPHYELSKLLIINLIDFFLIGDR